MINYYGIATRKEIELFTGEVCALFDGNHIINEKYDYHYNQKYLKAYNMQMETICVETGLGEYPDTDDKQGMGLSQIDRIKYDDIILNSQEHRDTIWNKWHIDINLVTFESLRYDWKSAIIFTRLGYKRIIAPIPSTRKERAIYWKKWWNTYKGKGSPEHYMKMCDKYLGEER